MRSFQGTGKASPGKIRAEAPCGNRRAGSEDRARKPDVEKEKPGNRSCRPISLDPRGFSTPDYAASVLPPPSVQPPISGEGLASWPAPRPLTSPVALGACPCSSAGEPGPLLQ